MLGLIVTIDHNVTDRAPATRSAAESRRIKHRVGRAAFRPPR